MKILIVEEDSLLALALEEHLRAAGHDIVGPVYDYSKALALATEERPALAIVDVEISNAEERTRLIWSLNGLLDIPSVVLTSRRQNVSRCEGAAVSIMDKPFQLEDILPVVERAADARAGSRTPPRYSEIAEARSSAERLKLGGLHRAGGDR